MTNSGNGVMVLKCRLFFLLNDIAFIPKLQIIAFFQEVHDEEGCRIHLVNANCTTFLEVPPYSEGGKVLVTEWTGNGGTRV